MYKLSLEIGLIVENGKINEAVFGNIVTLGWFTNDFDWTERFIEEYSIYLNKNIREGTVIYSNGTLHYFKGEYDKTIFLLTQHRFSSYHQVKVRLMTVRAIFEKFASSTTDYEFLISQIESFEKFLNRDNLQEKRKKDFIRLKKNIISQKNIALNQWLLNKIEEQI